MNNAVLLHMDGKWSLFENKRATPLLDYPRIESPVYVLSDFDGAISGVSVVNNKSSYAESLISRRLRDDGLIDGEVKVLVHYGTQTDGGYQVLYTAVPMTVWQSMQSWTQAQKEHCLLIPQTALMFDLLSSENEGVVFRSGRRFSLLVRRQKTMDYLSVLALSDHEDDLLAAARTLGERVQKRQPEGIGRLVKWKWYLLDSALSAESETALTNAFRESVGPADVQVAATESFAKKGGGQTRTALTELMSHFSERLAVNPLSSKANYFAEKNLVRVACCTGIIAAGLFIWGLVSLLQAKTIAVQTAQNVSATQKITQNLHGKALTAQQNKRFYTTRDFVDLMAKAQESADPYRFLRNLRFAAGESVKILRVHMQPESNSVVIEGWVEQTGGSDRPLAEFVE